MRTVRVRIENVTVDKSHVRMTRENGTVDSYVIMAIENVPADKSYVRMRIKKHNCRQVIRYNDNGKRNCREFIR